MLYNHQKKFLTANPDKALLAHGLGSGKTRTAIEWSKMRADIPLIVCPKGLIENWQRECEKWGLREKKIISKEQFKKLQDLNYKILIIDEADHFFTAHFKSQLAKSLKDYIKKHNPNLLLCSGTPYRSSPWNIFTAAYYLGYRWNFRKFQDAFFIQVRMGQRIVPLIKKGIEPLMLKTIARIADVFNPETAFDIPPQIDEKIYVKHIPAPNDEILPIVRFTKDHRNEAMNPEKLDIVLEYALKHDKVAIFCRYRDQLDLYSKKLKQQKNIVYELHGDIKNRQEVLDEVEKSDDCALLITTSTSEGYEVPSIGIIIYASMDFSYRNYIQSKGRFLRMNRLKKNVYIHLLAGKTDEAIMNCMKEKKDMDIIEAQKIYHFS